ncbi:hypothetical protein [Acidocella aminolytica]|uniref:Lipoprotein n=1 Tax=Acidocella aminolytica 101 = DSM 11237 TaxID=1120923 RepID=A0A0D6PHN6_9PROT|nr:hypothetical protein [Acidocella aminolytica]GAN81280.1 hypothetical protein Aam_089_073 [Acidocella aminolytica 101 = DSM 11237]GBQ41079.1 hypothetical protein AA11237_2584 [Acidocella aminolytica 101 = DSM 11237]SHE83640.1 hypothetical protein SAMN02746095_01339 [Acidocella aminolytica 101 = DSM 11237]
MRIPLALLAALSLTSCAGGGTFLEHSVWPGGNPNAPVANSETAQRALGDSPAITPLQVQAGDVWPGPVKPFPTLSQVEQNASLPLGQGYIPSLPSPYPPGPKGHINGAENVTVGGALYPTQDGQTVPIPATPGDAR